MLFTSCPLCFSCGNVQALSGLGLSTLMLAASREYSMCCVFSDLDAYDAEDCESV